jgi:hypothetical protein
MVTASLTTPAIVTVTALVTETRTYSVKTIQKASAPPKSIKKQVRAKCAPLSKYLLSLNSLHGSRRRERRPVAIAITGATQLMNMNGFFSPNVSFYTSCCRQNGAKHRKTKTTKSKGKELIYKDPMYGLTEIKN